MENREYGLGTARSTHGSGVNTEFGYYNLMQINVHVDLDVYGRIILKWILQK
jgi:hypothetical protein